MPGPSPADPLKVLQAAARNVAEHVAPGHVARRVVVFGENGAKLLDAAVPLCACVAPERSEPNPQDTAGWFVTDAGVYFDGQPVTVRGRNLDVLRVLIAGDVVATDELRPAWGKYPAEEGTIRWQVGELRKSLKKLFGDFPGELIESTGSGYRLLLR